MKRFFATIGFLLAATVAAFAQTVPLGPRFVLPYQTVVDGTGVPIPGAQLNFYASGTNTRLNTYSDALLTTPNTNPVVANSAGVFPSIFLNGNYKVVLTDSAVPPNQIWTADPVDSASVNGEFIAPGTPGDIPVYNSAGTGLQDATSIVSPQNLYLGAGRPWCDPIAHGAVPDGASNSLAAFNACLVELGGVGGTIWLDTVQGVGSTYCLKPTTESATFTLNVPIRIISASPSVTLSSCGSGFSVLQVSAPSILDGFYITGPGFDGETAFGASEPTLILANGANGTKLYNIIVYGGAPTILWNCPECQAYNVNAAFAYVNGSSIAAEWYFANGGGELYNVSGDDNEYPYGIPTPPFTYTAWATNQSVATNAVRTAACQDGNSYVIQAKVGGTTASSGTGPTCKNYGGASQTFTDGTVTWSLSHPTLLYHWQADTGTADLHIHQADTGGGNVGFGLTNTQSGSPPDSVSCVTCNGGNSYTAQIYGLASGGDIRFVSDNFAGCLKTNCYVMDFESTFAGGVEITGGNAYEGQNGIKIAGGSNYLIVGANLTGNATALAISGSASQIVATGNNVHGATTGISIGGTASEVTFTHNVGCNSGSTTCVSNSSSGADIVTAPNDDGTTPVVTGGTAAGSTLTLKSTSSGSPSGDAVDVVGSSVNIAPPTGVGNVTVNVGTPGGTTGAIAIAGPTSNAETLEAAASATGTATLPSGNYNVVGDSVSQSFTNKTIASSTDTLGGVSTSFGSDATGDMYYRNSGGQLARVPVCTGTQVLGAAGGVPACVTQGGGGGANTYLCTITASNSSVLSYASPTTGTCTINSSYSSYLLVFQNIVPATTEKILQLQIHSGGAFKSSGYLSNEVFFVNNGTTGAGSITTYIPLTYPSDSNSDALGNTAPGFSGWVQMNNPAANAICFINGQGGYLAGSGALGNEMISGFWNTAGVVDGFQVEVDGGTVNITSGSVIVYGIQ
jgi:hypothetical protein